MTTRFVQIFYVRILSKDLRVGNDRLLSPGLQFDSGSKTQAIDRIQFLPHAHDARNSANAVRSPIHRVQVGSTECSFTECIRSRMPQSSTAGLFGDTSDVGEAAEWGIRRSFYEELKVESRCCFEFRSSERSRTDEVSKPITTDLQLTIEPVRPMRLVGFKNLNLGCPKRSRVTTLMSHDLTVPLTIRHCPS